MVQHDGAPLQVRNDSDLLHTPLSSFESNVLELLSCAEFFNHISYFVGVGKEKQKRFISLLLIIIIILLLLLTVSCFVALEFTM